MLIGKIDTRLGRYQSGAVNKVFVASLFGVLALFVMAWTVLPTSFSTDLERIGKGKPAIVLIYDTEHGGSLNLMEGYSDIRHEYEHQVEFLVADIASPKGSAFIRSRRAPSGTAIYYSSEGEQIMVLHGPQEVAALIDSIKNMFNL